MRFKSAAWRGRREQKPGGLLMPHTRRTVLTATSALLLGTRTWAQANPQVALRQAVADYVQIWKTSSRSSWGGC